MSKNCAIVRCQATVETLYLIGINQEYNNTSGSYRKETLLYPIFQFSFLTEKSNQN